MRVPSVALWQTCAGCNELRHRIRGKEQPAANSDGPQTAFTNPGPNRVRADSEPVGHLYERQEPFGAHLAPSLLLPGLPCR